MRDHLPSERLHQLVGGDVFRGVDAVAEFGPGGATAGAVARCSLTLVGPG
ncbi:hypothetical protein [Amycolatopsis sp. GA6-003]